MVKMVSQSKFKSTGEHTFWSNKMVELDIQGEYGFEGVCIIRCRGGYGNQPPKRLSSKCGYVFCDE